MINFRNAHLNKTCDCRAHSTSTDGGATWATPVVYDPALVEPVCSAGLINTAVPVAGSAAAAPMAPSTGESGALFFSNPADTSHRDKMTVRRSDDSGATWGTSKLVWAGPASYSTLVAISDTHIGLVFENGAKSPYERISFVPLPQSLDGVGYI